MSGLPRVSIVTPSLNMAPYLRAAIDSVLTQDYPRIEYIVMDGGSTDGSLAILRQYGDRLKWVSAPDRGAADAIHRGLEVSSGAILGWLNADDTYLPGAVAKVVERFQAEPGISVVYGLGHWVDSDGEILGPYPTQPFHPDFLTRECPICQPAAWFRREAFFDTGGLDRTLHCCFDYDLWIRMVRRYRFALLEEYLATSRMHVSNKTLASRKRVFEESMQVVGRHYGYVPLQQVYAYCCYLRDGRDQFFDPLRHSLRSYFAALRLGFRTNSSQRTRFAREWLSMLTARRFRQLLSGTEAARPWVRVNGEVARDAQLQP